MRCAVYVRVSTDDQRDNGYSIDSQLRWVKLMNNYKNIAEEIILKELIYTENV